MQKRHLSELPPAQQAGILCNQPNFDAFCLGRDPYCTDAADHVRATCQIKSRRDLNTDPAARARWDRLVTEYDAWRGKLPAQN